MSDVLNDFSLIATWVLQVGTAYLACLILARAVMNARVRERLWAAFLFLALSSWLFVLYSVVQGGSQVGQLSATASTAISQNSVHLLRWSGVLHPSWSGLVARAATWVSFLYFSVVLLAVLHWVVQWARVFPRESESSVPPADVSSPFEDIKTDLHVRTCSLSIVPGLRSPCTAGWFKPKIFLPSDLFEDLQAEDLRSMLRHELAHVRRRDFLWDRMASLFCRVAFFHPVIWLAFRALARERELACDEVAAGPEIEDRLNYAEALVRLARCRQPEFSSKGMVDFSSPRSSLEMRVRSLLEGGSQPSVWQRTKSWTALLGGILFLSRIVPAMGVSLDVRREPAPLPSRAAVAQYPSPIRKIGIAAKPKATTRASVQVNESRSAARVEPLAIVEQQSPAIEIAGLLPPNPASERPLIGTPRPASTIWKDMQASTLLPTAQKPNWMGSPNLNENRPTTKTWKRKALGIAALAGAALLSKHDDDRR